jgi:inositol-1,3,4-trisphosphate 5/6-kinase/inositol-tetrakisphosphate 1-kinase
VYVIGDAIKVVRRYSLPDLGEGDQVSFGVKSFPRVSSAAATVEEADLDPEVAGSVGLTLPFYRSACIWKAV